MKARWHLASDTRMARLALSDLGLGRLFELTREAIAVVDARTGGIVRWNPAAERIFGYSEDEAITLTAEDLVPPALNTARPNTALEPPDPDLTLECVAVRKSGEHFWIELNRCPLASGGFGRRFVITSFRDLSRQRQADEASRRSEARLSEAQAMAHIGSWEWPLPAGTATCSDELYRLFGYAPQCQPFTYDMGLRRIHPEDRPAFDAILKAALQAHLPFAFDCRVVHPDGTCRDLHLKGEVIRDADGEAVRMVGTIQDVTERKALVTKLRDQYEALRKLDRLKDNFVNSITHELRTPITSIVGYAEFLEDEIGGPLTTQQHCFLTQITAGAKRLENLVNDLLDFARAEASTFNLTLEMSAFEDVARETAASFMTQAEEAGVALDVDLPEDLPLLQMDTGRIAQVLTHMLSNAIKFTARGGWICVRARVDADFLWCEVEDSGEGIAASDMGRLFQRFSQLEPGVEKGRGTGLGLHVCKVLVEAHGGTIGVRSVPAKGSVFWFTLPLERPA